MSPTSLPCVYDLTFTSTLRKLEWIWVFCECFTYKYVRCAEVVWARNAVVAQADQVCYFGVSVICDPNGIKVVTRLDNVVSYQYPVARVWRSFYDSVLVCDFCEIDFKVAYNAILYN